VTSKVQDHSDYHWIYVIAIRKPAQIIDIVLETLFREWVLKDRSLRG
jgi:hypothetical protein